MTGRMVSWDDAAEGYGIGRRAAETRPTPPDLFGPGVPPDRDEPSFLHGYYKGIRDVLAEIIERKEE